MYRQIYNWNIVACDVKQHINYNNPVKQNLIFVILFEKHEMYMHIWHVHVSYSTNEWLKNDTKGDNLVTLTVLFILILAIKTFVSIVIGI